MFKNKLDPKQGVGKMVKSPWDFSAPQYDERTSCFVSAGTHFGVGHRQPVGTASHSNTNAVPKGRVSTMRVDEAG